MTSHSDMLFVTAFIALFVSAHGLASVTPPTAARPVVVGTSEYSNVLFGKLQRAAALWGTNLGEPMTIVSPGDKEQKLSKCLWNQFYMANPGTYGTLTEKDLVKPLSSSIPQADLKDSLLFFDVTTSAPEPSPLSFFPFGKKDDEKDDEPTVPTINANILQSAVDRGCAHVYVLANGESLESCRLTLEQYANIIPSTIIALEGDITMKSTQGWVTSRPQNMEGEFLRPVSMRAYNPENYFSGSNAVIPAEDVAEVMMHLALRTGRSFVEYPRVVQISPGDDPLVERRNADYFTLTTTQEAGTVQSVASWEQFLSPLGEVNAELGKRPDQIE
eukprot:CAMPEP_0198140680 /NCGR_PEP_ID=MMETSP1443-20131203/3815_1 /TAXON_ID=186043 /ORGANISM="Entomoneis sp., Strain CCMP2396" /LENGTH=330 /DNA_ID=CAMNT_0043803189 /DNA_START=46 /DNA_END=1038 /DNA_ORIENTATION=-